MRSVRLLRNDKVGRVLRPFRDSVRFHRFGGDSAIKNSEIPQTDPYEGNFIFSDCDQYTKVTVIGAAGRVGRTLSLLLKTCPLVDHLCLFDTDKSVKGVGVDISHIDTKCCVSYVCGMRNIHQALDGPDVVVIAAGCSTSPYLDGNKLFEKNAPIVAGLSEACARFCPKACIVLITSPINSLLPVMGEVYQLITNRIPSRKLFGLTMLDVVRANTFVAEVVRKDPNSVIVPVIGGTSRETIVPVISQMKPCCKIRRGEIIALTECIKQAEGHISDCQNCGTRGASTLSTAYAAFRFMSSLVMALKGAENIIECAFVKSDIIPELEYLASPVKLGLGGVEYNFGYPQLSDHELTGLEEAATTLMSDISVGKSFVGNIEETIRKGLIWKRLSEEVEKKQLDGNSDKSEPKEILKKMKKTNEKRKRVTEKAEIATGRAQLHQCENLPMYSSFAPDAQPPLDNLCFCSDVQEKSQLNCNGISANLNTCKDRDKGLGPNRESIENPESLVINSSNHSNVYWSSSIKKILPGHLSLLPWRKTTSTAIREYHTPDKANERKIPGNYKDYLMKDRQKTVMPTKVSKFQKAADSKYKPKKTEITLKKLPINLKFERALYKINSKDLNATAKKKFRSFNVKKVTPGESVLSLLDKKKQDEADKNLGLILNNNKEKGLVAVEEKGQENEVEMEVEEESENDETKELETAESTKHKVFILKQLQELKRENEELKQKLDQITQDKNLEKTLLLQAGNLEPDGAKLRSRWLTLSSTVEAISSFCQKLISKTDPQLLQVVEADKDRVHESVEGEYEDSLDTIETNIEKQKKEEGYDEKYYNYLEKLMEDRGECEKSENRM